MKKQKIKFTKISSPLRYNPISFLQMDCICKKNLPELHFWRLSNLLFAAYFHENSACIKGMQFYLKEKNATASKLNVV